MTVKPAPAAAPAAQPVSEPAAAPAATPNQIQPLAEIFDNALARTRGEPAAPAAPAAGAAAPATPKGPAPIFGKPAAAPAAPAAAEPADEGLPEKLPDGTPEPVQTNWAKAREARVKMRTELAAKAKEVEDLRAQAALNGKASPAEAAEIERLRTEHKALLDRVAIIDLQSHPDYLKQFVTPKQEALKAAKEVLDYNGQENVELDSLLSLPLKAFNAKVADATKDLNSMDATTVQTALRSAYTLNQSGKQALANAGELGQKMAQTEAVRAKQTFEEVWGHVKVADELFVPVEAPDDASPEEKQQFQARNEALTQLRSTAERNVFGKLDHKSAAILGAKAAVSDFFLTHEVPRITSAYNRLAARNQQLETELAAIKQSRSPGSITAPAAAAAGGKGAKKSEEAIWTEALGR